MTASQTLQKDDFDIIIVGSGFAGIGMAIQLKLNTNFTFAILEKEKTLGGTWRDNNYPGAACDVPSYLYSFSFEPYYQWSKMFSPHNEILDYQKYCAQKYEIDQNIIYNQEINKAVFCEDTGKWEIHTKRGRSFKSKAVIAATGPLNKVKIPPFKGMKRFKGKSFHSSMWDHNFDYRGKKVAVVGTGASAIQIVPSIAEKVDQLYLFQRTAPWVLPKPDRKIGDAENMAASALPIIQKSQRERIYWQLELNALAFTKYQRIFKIAEMQGINHIKKYIKDKTLQTKLIPNYTIGCKRILLSNDYYPALARTNVNVITNEIETFNEKGLQTINGNQFDVDLIVYATGFDASENQAPFEIRGLDNQNLQKMWMQGGEAYKGAAITGFPNAFMVVGPNTGLGHTSMIFMMESQYPYILQGLKKLMEQNVKYLNVKQKEQEAYNKKIQEKMKTTIWHNGGCKSWYLNENGKNTTLWPGFTYEYKKMMKRFDVENYEIIYKDQKKKIHKEREKLAEV